ncbi:Type II secretion system protein [Verrucomicrobia bacterium]|nr:Type II secretion system protein [Verrucomicrobiota bacterium]
MSDYTYVAIDARGLELRGRLEVADQSEALKRIREMGLFPTKVLAAAGRRNRPGEALAFPKAARPTISGTRKTILPWFGRRVSAGTLTVFTRQLATLIEAGLPLLRGLLLLEEQEESPGMKRIIDELARSIENGGSFGEAVAMHPKVFNRLYVSMVKAGELAGALEATLGRLAEFMEKGRRIKGKVKAAMFYPCSVLVVAAGILILLMTYVIPRFREVFEGLLPGAALPAFTQLVFNLSRAMQSHLMFDAGLAVAAVFGWLAALRTTAGRSFFDRCKLTLPVLGPVFRKLAIARFTRTLGTLINSGVPILQALNIVKETADNVVVSQAISNMHDRVKEGDPMAPSLKESGVFPAMVAGMIDVGEQTGALPEMLVKVADNYDEEVDNAVSAMTSLLEPIMIVFLAVIVGSIVIAMFLPLIHLMTNMDGGGGPGGF